MIAHNEFNMEYHIKCNDQHIMIRLEANILTNIRLNSK